LALLAAPAWADWNEGDPYKMHYPQLPDPFGWDVSFAQTPLADDWECSQTGPVDDIHIWLSFQGDRAPGPEPFGGVFGSVTIWSNVPAGVDPVLPWSHPGEALWGMSVDTRMPNVSLRPYASGDQGWFDPVTGLAVSGDHTGIWQLNIDPAFDPSVGVAPFVQQRGEVYWLEFNLTAFDDQNPVPMEVGWKTSKSPHFMDDAVYLFGTGPPPPWRELRDPFTSQSLDLAFVITGIPEPATVVLMMLGVVGVVALSRRRA